MWRLPISAAMLIGRAQPLPERVALLHLNDLCKLLCWIGITPGVTTYTQALAIVQQVYGDRSELADSCSAGFCVSSVQCPRLVLPPRVGGEVNLSSHCHNWRSSSLVSSRVSSVPCASIRPSFRTMI